MKFLSSSAFRVAAVLFTVTLTGCAANQAAQHKEHHPQASSMSMTDMDMKSMCDRHKMMSMKTPEEQKAMMADHMKSMPPEMAAKMKSMSSEMKKSHMNMMDEKCK